METSMLDFFDYNITSPTGYQFLVRILKIARMAPKSKCAFRASYFAERCLQEHDMLVYRPSLVAAAAAYLALKQERPEPWVSACLPPHLPASLLLSPRLPPKALRVTPAYCFHGRASHSHSASPTHAQSAELQRAHSAELERVVRRLEEENRDRLPRNPYIHKIEKKD